MSNHCIAASLRFENGRLLVLDQYLLPQKQLWISIKSIEQLVSCIHKLQVRGAPLIGIAAALLIAQRALEGINKSQLLLDIQILRSARPTAVNLMYCMDKLRYAIEQKADKQQIVDIAIAIFKEDQQLCLDIAQFGQSIIKPGDNILTHCNTGALATAGIGTALGVITHCQQQLIQQQRPSLHVWVSETRPLLQGARLTTYELQQHNIAHKLICDSMAASLMAKGLVDKILVGADRIAANGDVANKVGTYNLAVLADYHHIPFYVVAPFTTVDSHCPEGKFIPIEQRPASEVMGINGSFGNVNWAPTDSDCYNPAFDVTPAKLISGWIMDNGLFNQQDVDAGIFKLDE